MSDLVGLSTEVKPKIADKPDLVEGTKYFEMDTLKTYKYSVTDDDWYLYSGGSSGGANPEIINSDEKHLADLDAIAVGWKEETPETVYFELTNVTPTPTYSSSGSYYYVDIPEGSKFPVDIESVYYSGGVVTVPIEFNGVLYENVGIYSDGEGANVVGNPTLYSIGSDNNIPFCILVSPADWGEGDSLIAASPYMVRVFNDDPINLKIFTAGTTEYHKIPAEYTEVNPEIIGSDEKRLADLDSVAVGWKEEVEVRDTWVEANNITEFDTQMTINNNVELDGTIEIGMDATVAPDVEYNSVLYTDIPLCVVGENDVFGFGNPYLYNNFYEDNDLPFFIHYGYLNDGINYWTILYVPKSVEYVDSIKVFKDPYTEIEYHKIPAEYIEVNPEVINSDKHLGDLNGVAVGWYEPEDIEHIELSGTLVRSQYDDTLLTSRIDCNFHIDLPDYPGTTPAPSIEFDGVTYDNLLTYAAGEGIAGFGNPHIFNYSFEYTSVPMFIYFDYEDYDEATRTVSKVRIMSEGDYLDEGPITVKLTAVNSPEQYHGIDAKYIGCESITSSEVVEFTDEFVDSHTYNDGDSDYVRLHDYAGGFTSDDFINGGCLVDIYSARDDIVYTDRPCIIYSEDDNRFIIQATMSGTNKVRICTVVKQPGNLPVGSYFTHPNSTSQWRIVSLKFNKPIEFKGINKIDSKYLPEVSLPDIGDDINLKDVSYLFAPYRGKDGVTQYPNKYTTCVSIELLCDSTIDLYPSDEGIIDIGPLIEWYYDEGEIYDVIFGLADCHLDIFCSIIRVHSSDDIDSPYETYYDVCYDGKLLLTTYHYGYYNLHFGSSSILGDFGFEAIISMDEEDLNNLSCEKAVIVNKNWIPQEQEDSRELVWSYSANIESYMDNLNIYSQNYYGTLTGSEIPIVYSGDEWAYQTLFDVVINDIEYTDIAPLPVYDVGLSGGDEYFIGNGLLAEGYSEQSSNLPFAIGFSYENSNNWVTNVWFEKDTYDEGEFVSVQLYKKQMHD